MTHAAETIRRSIFLVFVLIVLALASCGSGPVGHAEARWQSAGVEAYRLRLREFQSVWCVYDVDLEVQADRILSATVTARPGPAGDCLQYTQGVFDSPVPLPADEAPAHWTVSGMFEIAREWQEQAGQKGLRIELEFDPQLGYPQRIYRDDETVVDEDWGLSITALEVLPRGEAE